MTKPESRMNLNLHEPSVTEEDEPKIKFAPTVPTTVEDDVKTTTTVQQFGRTLCKTDVSLRLSMLGKTADGDGYTYLKIECTNMNLVNIDAMVNFKHLQFVDVSNNSLMLKNLMILTKLPYLLMLRADYNQIDNIGLDKMKYMQVMVFNNNQITSVGNVFQPELVTLEVGSNAIEKIYFDKRMPQIKCLDFRYNKIKELLDMNFPNLDSLYLAGNKIKSLEGIQGLVNLRILHLRFNPIKSLNGFTEDHKKLKYLNLRNCKIRTLREVKKLKVLPALEALIMKGCPYMGGTGEEIKGAEEEDESETRVEVLATLQRLKRLNKTEFTDEERTEAKDLLVQWLEEGDKEEDEEEEMLEEEEINEQEINRLE